MAFPGGTRPSREQIKEAGGQPLPVGNIANGDFLTRSGINIVGVAGTFYTGVGTEIRLINGYLELYNPDTSLWHKINVRGAVGFEQITMYSGTA